MRGRFILTPVWVAIRQGDRQPHLGGVPRDVADEEREVSDIATLSAAVLHDTIEDTETTSEELEAAFGAEVRHLVEEVTDDKSLEKQTRKQLQVEHAPGLSPGAKMIKLADLSCNLADIIENPPAKWSMERRSEYLSWTERVIAGCRSANDRLEQHYDQLLRRGRSALA